jgi:hypothetical protein
MCGTNLFRGTFFGAIIALATVPTGAEPPVYTPEFLGPGNGAAAINDSGVVVGDIILSTTRAWVASSGAELTLLPLPEGFISARASDINEAGVIVGVVSEFSDPYYVRAEAASWTPDGQGGYAVHRLGKLPGHVSSWATALNDVGDIVGYSSNGTFRYPVLFTGTGVADLTFTGIFDPQDVNDRRFVVDSSFTVKRLDLNTMEVEDLGVPSGAYIATGAAAINEENQVAGVAILATSTNCDREAARYTDGIGWEILSGCGSSNHASDMNDVGDVVMRLNVAPWVRIEGEGTFVLEDLIENDVGHWYVINAGPSMNNAGQLVVWAHNPTTGEAGTLLLTPRASIASLTDSHVAFGSLVSGTLEDLVSSDDRRVRVRSQFGFTAFEPNLLDLRIGAMTAVGTPASMDISVEGRLNQPGGTSRLRLRNWSTNAFDSVHQYLIGVKEIVETITAIDATDRVRLSDGRIEVSIRQSVLVVFSAGGFHSFTDHLAVAVE